MTSEASDLHARIRRLEDRAAIADAVDAYVYALDGQRWDELSDLFAEEAELESVGLDYRSPGRDGVYAGRQRILEGFYGTGNPRHRRSDAHRTGHYATNLRIRLDGDAATSLAYYFEVVDDTDVIAGTYEHRFRRDADRWRIAALRITVIYRGTLHGERFGGLPLADVVGRA